jgi:glycosyltransferase involved in cell wall biosynthesis
VARLFVCDPVCVLEYGHNVPSLKYFAGAFTKSFDQVIPVCCKLLPEPLISANRFVPHFGFYYEQFIHLPNGAKNPDEVESQVSLRHLDPIETQATADAVAMLQDWQIGKNDALFYPSVDFYGVIGLLGALEMMPSNDRPRVFLRFIGVMENATNSWSNPFAELVLRLRDAVRIGIPLSFSAEAPIYADLISEKLDVAVAVAPYPHVGAIVPMEPFGPFVVYCPGSARADKGYFDLWEIFSRTRRLDFDLSIRFVTQIMPDRDAVHHDNYTSQLSALPGVEILPASISEAEMVEQYHRCHAVLLPYDAGTYALRGSAVMMEAAYLGRRIITLPGTGFADQISYYGFGEVVPNVSELPGAILKLSREPRARLQAKATQARHRFVADSTASYMLWIGAH